jgi:hypothetical protein
MTTGGAPTKTLREAVLCFSGLDTIANAWKHAAFDGLRRLAASKEETGDYKQ